MYVGISGYHILGAVQYFWNDAKQMHDELTKLQDDQEEVHI